MTCIDEDGYRQRNTGITKKLRAEVQRAFDDDDGGGGGDDEETEAPPDASPLAQLKARVLARTVADLTEHELGALVHRAYADAWCDKAAREDVFQTFVAALCAKKHTEEQRREKQESSALAQVNRALNLEGEALKKEHAEFMAMFPKASGCHPPFGLCLAFVGRQLERRRRRRYRGQGDWRSPGITMHYSSGIGGIPIRQPLSRVWRSPGMYHVLFPSPVWPLPSLCRPPIRASASAVDIEGRATGAPPPAYTMHYSSGIGGVDPDPAAALEGMALPRHVSCTLSQYRAKSLVAADSGCLPSSVPLSAANIGIFPATNKK